MGHALEPLSGAEVRTLRDILRKLVSDQDGIPRRRR
jgi:hypothetical protein